MSKDYKSVIPIFFAADKNYIPFLAVAIKSLTDNASKEYFYNIHILTGSGFCEEDIDKLKMNMSSNSRLIIDNVKDCLAGVEDNLEYALRDYYTISIFYRLFIASLYPNYKKVIYLDCDIVVPGDISKFYIIELDGNILGAIVDDVIVNSECFRIYSNKAIGVDFTRYFNSGVLLIDLDKYREEMILENFIYLIKKYNFETIAPDQDYLNVLCKDRVKYIEKGWDLMPIGEIYKGEIYLIHYNNFRKPWYYDDVLYGEYFWKYARKTSYYEDILTIKNTFSDNLLDSHIKGLEALKEQAKKMAISDSNFNSVLHISEENCEF